MAQKTLPECQVDFLCAAYTQTVECGRVNMLMRVLNWNELQRLPEDEQIPRVQELSIDAVLHDFSTPCPFRADEKSKYSFTRWHSK